MGHAFLTCAIVGNFTTRAQNENLPITPSQIADDCLAAEAEGAAIVHIHVRDPISEQPSMDTLLYREVVDRIRAQSVAARGDMDGVCDRQVGLSHGGAVGNCWRKSADRDGRCGVSEPRCQNLVKCRDGGESRAHGWRFGCRVVDGSADTRKAEPAKINRKLTSLC